MRRGDDDRPQGSVGRVHAVERRQVKPRWRQQRHKSENEGLCRAPRFPS